MARGFFGMSGASALGCGNDWTGPATTSPMTSSPRSQGFQAAPTMARAGTQVQIRGSAPAPKPEGTLDQMQLGKAIGCTLCDAKKKLIAEQRRAAGIVEQQYTMGGFRRTNMGRKSYDEEGTLGCPSCGLDGARIAGARLGQVCARTEPKGLNCQKTASGDIVCSDGIVYAPDCPHSPVVNVPGVAETTATGPKVPAPPSAAPAPDSALAPAGGPTAAPADSGISPLAIGAGALVGIGLLFVIFK